MRRFLTKPEIQQIIELYESGLSTVEVGREVGRAQSVVSRVLIKHGIAIRRGSCVSEDEIAEIAALYQEGKSFAEIGRMLKRSKNTIATIVRRNKISAPPCLLDKVPQEVARQIIDRYQSGEGAPRISQLLGLEPIIVWRILKKYGVYIRSHQEAAVNRWNLAKEGRGYEEPRYLVTSPDGEVFKVANLKGFCESRGLSPNCLGLIARGKMKNHKGWTCKYINPPSPPLPKPTTKIADRKTLGQLLGLKR